MEGISKLLARRAKQAAGEGVREIAVKGVGLAVVALLFICAFVFGLIAIFHGFAAVHGPVVTALVMSLVLALLGGLTLFIAQNRAKHARQRRKMGAAAFETEYKTALSLANQIGRDLGRKSKLALPVLALAIGFLLATRKDDD